MIANPSRTYSSLDAAFDYFNRASFDGRLPPRLITMQRHRGAYGHFHGDRFASLDTPGEVANEIALNPAHFAGRPTAWALSTLAHEMAHLWQHHFGVPSRAGYHNRQWATKMREIGMIPSDTGKPGGKETGQSVSHVIEPGGRFERACTAFLATSSVFLYHDRIAGSRGSKAASKTKYTCPSCGVNARAKPYVRLVCGDCGKPMGMVVSQAKS